MATELFDSHVRGQLIERLRYLHYSIRTEEAYVYWARRFIRWHGLRHPREMVLAPPVSGTYQRTPHGATR